MDTQQIKYDVLARVNPRGGWQQRPAYRDPKNGVWHITVTMNGYPIATVNGNTLVEAEAVANMVTAAPKLLHAARWAHDMLNNKHMGANTAGILEDAIKSAEGETRA